MQEQHRRYFTAAAAEATVRFATTLGEDHHKLQIGFEDEGRREAREIMKNLVLRRYETRQRDE